MFTRPNLNGVSDNFSFTVGKDGIYQQKSMSPMFYSGAYSKYEARPGTPLPPMPRNVWMTNSCDYRASITNLNDERHNVENFPMFLNEMERRGLCWW